MDDKRLYLMGQEKIGKALRIMAIPAIIGMMVNSVYNIVDALFVGWLGKEQLGATGIAFPIFMLIGAFGISIGMGANSYISRLLEAPELIGLTGVLPAQTFADGLTLLTTAGFAVYIIRWINTKIKENPSDPAF